MAVYTVVASQTDFQFYKDADLLFTNPLNQCQIVVEENINVVIRDEFQNFCCFNWNDFFPLQLTIEDTVAYISQLIIVAPGGGGGGPGTQVQLLDSGAALIDPATNQTLNDVWQAIGPDCTPVDPTWLTGTQYTNNAQNFINFPVQDTNTLLASLLQAIGTAQNQRTIGQELEVILTNTNQLNSILTTLVNNTQRTQICSSGGNVVSITQSSLQVCKPISAASITTATPTVGAQSLLRAFQGAAVGGFIYNNQSQPIRLKFQFVMANNDDLQVILSPGGTYEIPEPLRTSAIYGWVDNAYTGNIKITTY